jgi:hypothetical protein
VRVRVPLALQGARPLKSPIGSKKAVQMDDPRIDESVAPKPRIPCPQKYHRQSREGKNYGRSWGRRRRL